MQPRDRVALMGPNGAGKSTLLRHIETQLQLSRRQVIWVPQEIRAEEAASILREVRPLAGRELGSVMQWVSLLGSDPGQLLGSEVPSPGEIRKLMLALRLGDAPALVVMDEPTNHMDLPSIECLESALSDFQGGLLLVSHDERFLSKLTTTLWKIDPDPACACRLVLRICSGGLTQESRLDAESSIV
jgi:ATPase subunit of ABC transporter with duplicated ATPase domains